MNATEVIAFAISQVENWMQKAGVPLVQLSVSINVDSKGQISRERTGFCLMTRGMLSRDATVKRTQE